MEQEKDSLSETRNSRDLNTPIETAAVEDIVEEEKVKTDDALSNDTTAGTYDPKNVHYEGDLAVYTDPNTGTQYEWNSVKNEWHLRESAYKFEGDTYIYEDKDGVKYFWDKEKSAWFPQIDDDFMAQYQMNYGFIEHEQTTTNKLDKNEEKPHDGTSDDASKPKAEKRKPTEPSWFEVNETENTNVYVSNLPTDITEQEFVDLMQKCGFVLRDPNTGNFKIKLYKEPGTDYLKGDALCTYIKKESVALALSLLDGSDVKGHKLKVELAKFEMKGAYDPKLKPKMKKRKEKLKLQKMHEKLFDWRPEKFVGTRAKHERVVIVKNLFDPKIFDTNVGLILELQEDLRVEAAKIGVVRKVLLYDRHPEGVAQINMSSPEEADEVLKMMNGRWFMKRQLSAEIWDGKTKFKIAETDAQINERLNKWDKFLEEDKPKEGSSAS